MTVRVGQAVVQAAYTYASSKVRIAQAVVQVAWPTLTPQISSLVPNSGKVGDEVVISGFNFAADQGDGTVTFGGTVATITAWADTEITCTVPERDSGACSVIVTNDSGFASTGITFTVESTATEITGQAQGQATLSGSLSESLSVVTGRAQAQATLSGDLSLSLVVLTGEIKATASLAGDIFYGEIVTGQASGQATLSGTMLPLVYPLTGRINASATLSGTMLPQRFDLTGAIEVTANLTAPVPYEISDGEKARYLNASQSFQVALGFTTAYSPSITNVEVDAEDKTHEHLTWKPFVMFGPNRLALVGESLKWYAGNCYVAGGGGVQNRYKSFSWGDGTPDTPLMGRETGTNGGIAYHSYAAAGVYTVTLTIDDPVYGTAHGHRYVRVVSSWADACSDVIDIGPISGSISQGGWTTELTIPTTLAAGITDGMGVVMRILPRWGLDATGGGGEPAPTDGFYESPLFCGYVVGGSIDWQWDKETVTFRVQTADYWLSQIWSYEQHFYSDGESGYGHFRSSGKISYPWVINHMLNVHSNFAEYHDVSVFIDAAVEQKSIVVGEGPLWQSVKDYAKGEFADTFVNKSGTLFIAPNKNIRGYSWWGSYLSPPTLLVDATVAFSAKIDELPTDRVGFVRLSANDPFSKTVLKAKYPSSPAAKGEWITESSVPYTSQATLNDYAERMYFWKNYRYEARITVGSFWLFDIGQVVPIQLADPLTRIDTQASVGGNPYQRPFDITALTFNLDNENMAFTIDLTLQDVPNVRWNGSAWRWEWYEDGSWTWTGKANEM